MTKGKKIVLSVLVVMCAFAVAFAGGKKESNDTIKILYTNDVHCGYTDNCGYTGLAYVKQSLQDAYNYVALVDCGDAIQGAAIGTVSYGEYIVDIMNEVGYDFAIFGNHEFDYGMDKLAERIEQANAQYLCSTVTYSGEKDGNKLAGAKPYEIVKYGKTKVAFIGVSTPESITKSTPTYFQDGEGNYIYDFATGEGLYECVQSYVKEVRKKGADYVIVLAHLGIEEGSAPNLSTDLIANTTGIDVVIDGHSHSTVNCEYVENKVGKPVLLTQTGTKLENIGVLTIVPGKFAYSELVQTTAHDAKIDLFIDAIDAEYKAALQIPFGKSEIELSINNADGARAVRNRETAIGDFCADAYRFVSGADVAFVNGGGIRATIAKGEINKEQLLAVHPYGNMLCVCEATGQEILDALEWGSKSTTKDANSGKTAYGESGGFLQVSGLKYTIDTSIPSSTTQDERGMFVSVNGPRRVKNVYVGSEETGWTPIDPNKTYTLACHDYKLKSMGDGYSMFADNNFIIDCAKIDNQVVIDYVTDFLGGVIPAAQYSAPQGRITVL